MTNERRLAVAFITSIATAFVVAVLVVVLVPSAAPWSGGWFSKDIYVPTESHVFNTAPELRMPGMVFTGVWGDLDMNAQIFQFDPAEAASEDPWNRWIKGLDAKGWTVVRSDPNSVHLRRIDDRRSSRRIGEVRAERTTSGRIVVSVVDRSVSKDSASLAESEVGGWLKRFFLPRFDAAIRDAETAERDNRKS